LPIAFHDVDNIKPRWFLRNLQAALRAELIASGR